MNRCKHEWKPKPGYPRDMICEKCMAIKHLSVGDILDDFSRDLKLVHVPDAHRKYTEARDKAIARLVEPKP